MKNSIKRSISVTAVAAVVVGLFNVMPVSAEEKYVSIPIDFSKRANAKVMLSESMAGTVTEANKPNYFVSQTTDTPIALNKDKVRELSDGNYYKFGNTLYRFCLDGEGNDSIYANSLGSGLSIDNACYAGFKVLATSTVNDGSNDGVVYLGFKFSDGSNQTMSFRPRAHTSSETNIAITAGTVGLSDTSISNMNGNIFEYSGFISVANSQKKSGSIEFWSEAKCKARVLAVTLLQTETEAKKRIAESIQKVLSAEVVSQKDILAAYDFIKLVENQNITVSDITDMDKFEELRKKCVSVSDYSVKTDDENIELSINFSSAISAKSAVKDNFTVTAGGKERDFEIENIMDDDDIIGVKLIMDNKHDYSTEIKTVVSGKIENAEDSSFTLGEDYQLSFLPEASNVYIKSADIKNLTVFLSCDIELDNKVGVKPYALTVGLFSADNEMKEKRVFTGTLSGKKTENAVFSEFEDTDVVRCFLVDGFETLNMLNCVIEG